MSRPAELPIHGDIVNMTDQERLINSSGSLNKSLWNLTETFEHIIRPCFAELIGVALFVFIGTTAICSGSASLEGIALAHGLTIALLVTAIGSVSGAHLNPAVTLGIFIAGAIAPIQAIFYVLAQLFGGILGAALALGVVGNGAYNNHSGGGHTLPASTYPGEAVLCETILTYLLVTTVLVAAVDSSSKNSLGPLAIGFAVTVDILAGASISGASMNPARSLGPAMVVNKSEVWDCHWIYWVGPVLGGSLAGFTYRFLLAGPEKRVFQYFEKLSR